MRHKKTPFQRERKLKANPETSSSSTRAAIAQIRKEQPFSRKRKASTARALFKRIFQTEQLPHKGDLVRVSKDNLITEQAPTRVVACSYRNFLIMMNEDIRHGMKRAWDKNNPSLPLALKIAPLHRDTYHAWSSDGKAEERKLQHDFLLFERLSYSHHTGLVIVCCDPMNGKFLSISAREANYSNEDAGSSRNGWENLKFPNLQND